MRARARMLSWKVSTDARVAALSCDSARLLYTWMIPHADNLGRLSGEPEFVRASIMPHQRTTTAKQVGAWLGEMAHAGLIQWYNVDGLRYIQLSGWDKHQQLRGNMKRTSDLPEPCVQRANGVHTTCEPCANGVCPEGKGEGEVEGEEEGKEHTLVTADAATVARSTSPAESKPNPRREWDDALELLWPDFPRKVGKPAALRAWRAVRPQNQATFDAIDSGLRRWRDYWRGKDREVICHPATWLNQRRWENEP